MIALGRHPFPHAFRSILAVLLLALAAGCANGGDGADSAAAKADSLVAARQNLVAALRDCSGRNDYDPDDPALPQNALAPHELKWRDCAYAAARDYTRVNTALALSFGTLIDEDRRMTQAIADGRMTRFDRRQRLQEMIEGIRLKEEAQIEGLQSEQSRDQDLARQVIEGLRGLN